MNGGWAQIMGPDSRDPQGLADLWMAPGAVYIDPEFSWALVVTPTSIIFLATDRYGVPIRNQCIVGDNNIGNLYKFVPAASRDSFVFSDPLLQDRVADNNTTEISSILWGQSFGVVTDLKLRSDGLLYIVSLSSGIVYRIENSATDVPPDRRVIAGRPVVLPAGQSAVRGDVRLRWWQPSDAPAARSLYTVNGRLVRVIDAPHAIGGENGVTWDGRDAGGRRVATGAYLCQLTTAGASASRIVLRME